MLTLEVAGTMALGAKDASTVQLEMGGGATGNRFVALDMIGDTTYTDYGLRISRGGSGPNTGSYIEHRGFGGLSLTAIDSGPVIFVTANTERARFTGGGDFFAGTTNFSYFSRSFVVEGASQVAAFINNDSAAYPITAHNTATTGDNQFVTFITEARAAGTTRGGIDYNRAAGQVRFNVTSDQRLKSDIQLAPSAVNVLSTIKVRSYKWKETGYQIDYGFIAQELNQVVPDAVKEGDDGDEVVDTWAVDNAKLVPLLTKALQEAVIRIEQLEATVAALQQP